MAKPNVIKKEDLIESAKECIVEEGIQNLTLKAVAERSGVTQGTVYYHFRSKDQLMLEIVKDTCMNSWESLANISKVEKEWDESWVKAALSSVYERAAKDIFYHKLFLSLVVTGFQKEQVQAEIKNLLQYENRVLQQQIESLIGDSFIKGISTKSWSIFLNALFDGLAIQSIVSEEMDVNQIYEDLEKLIKELLNNS